MSTCSIFQAETCSGNACYWTVQKNYCPVTLQRLFGTSVLDASVFNGVTKIPPFPTRKTPASQAHTALQLARDAMQIENGVVAHAYPNCKLKQRRSHRAKLACSVPDSSTGGDGGTEKVVAYGEYGKGAVASVVNITITYPANKVVFRQQLYGHGTISTAIRLHREGLTTLYRGVAMPMCHKALSTSLMFGTFDTYRRLIAQYSSNDVDDNRGDAGGHVSKWGHVAVYAAAGGLSGVTEAIIMPFERVQTLMQNPHYHDLYHTTTHAFRDVLRRGPKELYRGHAAVLLRNGLSSSVFFAVRQPVKDAVVTSEMVLGLPVTAQWLDPVHNFISGAILGATLSTMFYPLNVIKVYAERQTLRGMYAGCGTNFVRSLMSWGIINAVYEALDGIL